MILFIRGDVLVDKLTSFASGSGPQAVIARTIQSLAQDADEVVLAIERMRDGRLALRFAVFCPSVVEAKKKERTLALVLALFKQFMSARKVERDANQDNLGDRRILANDVSKLFVDTTIGVVDTTALITLRADVPVGNVLGLFTNVFGSSLNIGVVNVAASFDQATMEAAQPKPAVPAGVMAGAGEVRRRAQSIQRLTPWAKAMADYKEKHGALPDLAGKDKEGKPLLSWRVTILPELGLADLLARFHLDEAWDSPHNRPLADELPAELRETFPLARQTKDLAWNEEVIASLGRVVWGGVAPPKRIWTEPIEFDESVAAEWGTPGQVLIGPPGQAFYVPASSP
ncbi:DUF1559 domain-containing protein [bacterium]|nr:DUF1559 domain-containing protein [bacterium]